MIIIKTYPETRINDSFVRSNRIDATPVNQSVRNPMISGCPINFSTRYITEFYSRIALDIVTESVFNYPYPWISEKTLRPINCKRMFVIVGAPHTLAMLHSKGIKTFGDIIDESYDAMEDPEERFLAVVNSIEKFCALDLAQIKRYYKDNADKFSHNWQVLKNLPSIELEKFDKVS